MVASNEELETAREPMQRSNQLMRDAGEEFLAEALTQSYQDLDEAEMSIERLEDALDHSEEECARLAEDRLDMLARIAELNAQVAALRGDPVAPTPEPVQQPVHVAHAPVVPVAAPVVEAEPRHPRMSIRNTLDRVSQWMWDEPPDDLDEHIARSLRSRWRAGFVLACLVALVGLAGLAVAVGIPEVQNNVESKTALMETPEHYSTASLLEEQ